MRQPQHAALSCVLGVYSHDAAYPHWINIHYRCPLNFKPVAEFGCSLIYLKKNSSQLEETPARSSLNTLEASNYTVTTSSPANQQDSLMNSALYSKTIWFREEKVGIHPRLLEQTNIVRVPIHKCVVDTRKGEEAQQRILFQKTILFRRVKKWVGAPRPSRRLQRITFQWTSPRDNKGLPSSKSEKSVNLPSLIGTSFSSQVQLNGWTAIYFTFKSIFQKNVAFTNDSFKDREHSLPQSSSAKYKGKKVMTSIFMCGCVH